MQLALAPGMQRAVNQAEVAQDVADFADRIDQLVTAFDHTTEQRIERVVWIHRILAIGMALLLIFTIIWLRARLLRPWKQLLSMARAVSQRTLPSGRTSAIANEQGPGMALNNMRARAGGGSHSRQLGGAAGAGEDCRTGAEERDPRFLMAGQPPAALQRPALRTYFAILNGLQGLDAAARYRGKGLRPRRRR